MLLKTLPMNGCAMQPFFYCPNFQNEVHFASLISTDVQKMSRQTAHIVLPVLLPDDHLKFYKFAPSKSVVSSEKIRFVAISTCQIRFGPTMRVRAPKNDKKVISKKNFVAALFLFRFFYYRTKMKYQKNFESTR